jgi:hypothetical protein
MGSSATKSIELTSTSIATSVFDGKVGPGVEHPGISLTAKTLSINGGTLDTSAGFHDSMPAGAITLNGDYVALTNVQFVARDQSGGGGGGTVTLQGLMSIDGAPTHAKTVTIDGGGIFAAATSIIGGPGGTIAFHADRVTLENASLSAASHSRGGIINLADVGTLKIMNSTLSSAGDPVGGTIVLGSLATRSITLHDTILDVRGTSGSATRPGAAGTIDITATKFFKSIGSTFDASSQLGNGGSVSIRAGRLSLLNGSTVNAQGGGPGLDGSIHFEFGKKLTVKDSVVTPNATITSGWEAE